jgi:hypothetical protein
MKIRVVNPKTQPYEAKTKDFLGENTVEIDLEELWQFIDPDSAEQVQQFFTSKLEA